MTRYKLLITLTISLLVAGCGGGGGDDAPSGPPSTETPDDSRNDVDETTDPSIEVATVPPVGEGSGLMPPGVPRLLPSD